MLDLITRERALRNLDSREATGKEALLVDALIGAASEAIERYCNRRFRAREYDELYDGSSDGYLMLRNFPVLSVERVARGLTRVLYVKNTDVSTNQQARVKVQSDKLTLTRVASGTTTVNDLSFSSYATISALTTAINALGNGWYAENPDPYDNWPSVDLRPIQGNYNTAGLLAGLSMHVTELSDYEVDQARGILYRSGGWSRCTNYHRVIYTAGFEEVPEAIQEACAQWVALLFWQTKRDMGLVNESVPGLFNRTQLGDIPQSVKRLLNLYRARGV